MRTLTMLLMVLLSAGCALKSDEIRVASPAQHDAVVFDIDGTLTPGVYQIFTVREGAADAVRAFHDRGNKIIYLSARARIFQRFIPGWLKRNGFPDGAIHVPESSEDSRCPAAFKARILDLYTSRGWHVVSAYGDSCTDFRAYAAAKIEKGRVFALQREQGTQEGCACGNGCSCGTGLWEACWNGWSDNLQTIEALIQQNP